MPGLDEDVSKRSAPAANSSTSRQFPELTLLPCARKNIINARERSTKGLTARKSHFPAVAVKIAKNSPSRGFQCMYDHQHRSSTG